MPDHQNRPFRKIGPPVAAHSYDLRGRSNRASVRIQQERADAHQHPVDREQIALHEIENGIESSSRGTPSGFVKRRGGNGSGVTPQRAQPSDLRGKCGRVQWFFSVMLNQLRSRRIGFALSGGSVRGLAHLGVVKALTETGFTPTIITGTSVGSLIGAMLAAGLKWNEIASLARGVFWPKLLHGEALERFCAEHLPATFSDLKIPFAAVATELPKKRALVIAEGNLASAISASCALRVVRRPVRRAEKRLKDGGICCVLPSEACRLMGADFVVGSDVWEFSSLLRGFGIDPYHSRADRTYPSHYRSAVAETDLLIQPRIPLAGYLPSHAAIDRMISAGENAARLTLKRLIAQAA